MTHPQISVIGSINMDLVVRCQQLPQPGETIRAERWEQIPGGKGANQAVAAARAGADVAMIGRIGDDAFGIQLRNHLQEDRINCEFVQPTSGVPSGVAIVAVEDSGQNSIVVVPGSNGCVSSDDVQGARAVIEASDIVLLQLEIPNEAVIAAIEVARAANVKVVLDPAPAPTAWPDEFFNVDLMCPNETEAQALVGFELATIDDAFRAAEAMRSRGSRNVAITLGDKGIAWASECGQTGHAAALSVEALDSTAAGDAFAGAMAVRWAETNDLPQAIQFGNAAGAIAVSRRGAQPSMGTREEIEAMAIR